MQLLLSGESARYQSNGKTRRNYMAVYHRTWKVTRRFHEVSVNSRFIILPAYGILGTYRQNFQAGPPWPGRNSMEDRRTPAPEADGIIEGRNAVIEALRAGTAIDKIYLQKGETDKTLGHIASKARSA
ncbi:RNA methyltransferase substrate-binding domain-containing protein, partial [Acutalibacter muris]|uniref:RNA methyltransferase substrate-binding domain-containing protein n=1 Tax=Acutalibacter muris TaxID=1796620 RepID=UPI002F3EC45D